MKLLSSAQLARYNRLKDRSVTITFETDEKTSEDIAKIDSMLDCFGYLLFKPENRLTEQEIEEIDNIETDLYDNKKTQSQRLRNVLYVYFQQRGLDMEFKDFYKSETDRIIEHYKRKLDSYD